MDMGETRAKVRLLSNGRNAERELLVDTGSTFSWISAEVLQSLGVTVEKVWKFHTIDGRVIERRIGFIFMECLGERGPSVTVFAEPGDAEVLGLHALEGLRLEVDLVSRTLRKSSASLALLTR